MLNRKQRKQNNKELTKLLGEQFSAIRKEKKILLEDMALEYYVKTKYLDELESGIRILPL